MALLHWLGQAKRWEEALQLFNSMPQPDLISVNSLLSALARAGLSNRPRTYGYSL